MAAEAIGQRASRCTAEFEVNQNPVFADRFGSDFERNDLHDK